MAFKLDKADQKRRDEYVAQLSELAGKLQDAVTSFNVDIEDLKRPVNDALAAYNEALAEAKGFAEDIASTADGEFDDKSEKWQEGEKAEEAREWIDHWEGIDLEEVEIAWPEDLVDPEFDHASELEALPVAAGE